jgi:MFS transporter, UMF1 family
MTTGANVGAQRREQVGWYFYDWANSAFSTTVVTVFLGPYLTGLAEAAANADGRVWMFGLQVAAGSFFPYMVSLSVLLQVLMLPILGAIADHSRRKRELLGLFAWIGALATVAMYWLEGDRYLLGGLLFLVANLAFGGSMVFYNAFLPEIAAVEDRDRVSSQGWAMGYLGGGLLLAVNLVFFTFRAELGVETGMAVRISLASAGIWWALFTLIPFSRLRDRGAVSEHPFSLALGFRQLAATVREARKYPQTLLFLAAYLLYNDGIQAVIALASVYGAEELGMGESTLISTILLVQFVAFGGALAFGVLARRFGAKRTLAVSLVIWTAVVTYGYFVPAGNVNLFYLLGASVAVVMGGSQALSRSLFAQMIPQGKEAEYFSLYEVGERGTSWLAPLFFGLAFDITGSYRIALISLIIFFAAGLLLLVRVNVRRAIIESGNQPRGLTAV